VLIGTQVLLSTFGYKMICYSLESLGILELQFTHTIERTEKTLLFFRVETKKTLFASKVANAAKK
jgi:hypothetical protein